MGWDLRAWRGGGGLTVWEGGFEGMGGGGGVGSMMFYNACVL